MKNHNKRYLRSDGMVTESSPLLSQSVYHCGYLLTLISHKVGWAHD